MKDQEKELEILKAEFVGYLTNDLWFRKSRPAEETFEAYKALSLTTPVTEKLHHWLSEHPEDLVKTKLPEMGDEELRIWFEKGSKNIEPNPGELIRRLGDAFVRELQSMWSASRLRPELSLGIAVVSDKERLNALVSSACKDIAQLAQAQGRISEADHVCKLLGEVTGIVAVGGDKSEAIKKTDEALAKMATWFRKGDTTFTARLKQASSLIIALQRILEEKHEL